MFSVTNARFWARPIGSLYLFSVVPKPMRCVLLHKRSCRTSNPYIQTDLGHRSEQLFVFPPFPGRGPFFIVDLFPGLHRVEEMTGKGDAEYFMHPLAQLLSHTDYIGVGEIIAQGFSCHCVSSSRCSCKGFWLPSGRRLLSRRTSSSNSKASPTARQYSSPSS